MPRNFKRYWPDPINARPDLKRRTHQVAGALAKGHWDGGHVVKDTEEYGVVRPHELRIPEVADPVRPYVEHFIRLNPGYLQGDALACLCPLDWGNLIHMVAHMVRKALRSGMRRRRAAPGAASNS